MAADPREAVLEHLTRKQSGEPREVRPVARSPRWTLLGVLRAATAPGLPLHRRLAVLGWVDRSRPVPVVRRSGFGADADRVVFLKERGIPRRRLFAVNFEDDSGQPRHWLVAAEQDEGSGGWTAHSVAGGGGSFGQHDPWRDSRPRINLAGGWGANGYYAGGAIHSAGAEVARVRLAFANGVRLEDDTEGDLALFLTDQPVELPITVEFLDATGSVVAKRVELEEVKTRQDELRRRHGLQA